MTKIYCDIADKSLIKIFNRKKIVKGFTTNPSLMRKAGAKNYQNYCKQILKITNKPISFEVFADNEKEIIHQALVLKKIGKNVEVKIPISYTNGKTTKNVIKKLVKEKVHLNITAIFNYSQVAEILPEIKNTKPCIKDPAIGSFLKKLITLGPYG